MHFDNLYSCLLYTDADERDAITSVFDALSLSLSTDEQFIAAIADRNPDLSPSLSLSLYMSVASNRAEFP